MMSPVSDKGPGRYPWILLGTSLALLMVLYSYADNPGITYAGMNVWTLLRDGNLPEFYDYNSGMAPPGTDIPVLPVVYGFLTFAIIAVWNLPLWLLQELADVNVFTSMLGLTWMKLITVPFLLGTAVVVDRIGHVVAPDNPWRPWTRFVLLSSGFLVAGIFVMGQFDILHAFFTMLGLYFLVRGRNRAFLAAFAVAAAIKWFPLFVFLPVLLLKEKRPTRILLMLGSVLAPALLLKVPFMFAPNPDAQLASDLMTTLLMGNTIPVGVVALPIFPLLFCVLCIACYLHQPETQHGFHVAAFYAAFAGPALFFISAPAFPYWFAMLCPLFAILWLLNPGRARVNLLIETGMTAAMVVLHQIHFFWTYGTEIVDSMLLSKLFSPVGSLAATVQPVDVYTQIGFSQRAGVLGAMFTAAMIVLLFINRPVVHGRPQPDGDPGPVDRPLVYGRAAITIGLCLAPAVTFLYSFAVHGTIR